MSTIQLYIIIVRCEQRDGPPRPSAHHVTGRLKKEKKNICIIKKKKKKKKKKKICMLSFYIFRIFFAILGRLKLSIFGNI